MAVDFTNGCTSPKEENIVTSHAVLRSLSSPCASVGAASRGCTSPTEDVLSSHAVLRSLSSPCASVRASGIGCTSPKDEHVLPSYAQLRSLSSPCATVRAASSSFSLPNLESDGTSSTSPKARRRSLREKQDAAIQATWLRRQAIKLKQDQDLARRQRMMYSATKASMDGFTNETLKSWSLANLPASVPLSFPSPNQLHAQAESEPSSEIQRNLLCGFLEHTVKATQQLVEVLHLEPEEKFFDLGSGDGRVVISVVKHFGCKGVGIELNRLLIQQANAHAQSEFAMTPHLLENITFIHGDISRMDLSEARVIFIYMPRTALQTLLGKVLLRTGIRDGTLIYTSDNWVNRKEAPHLKHRASHWKSGIHCYEWHVPLAPLKLSA